MEDKLQTCCICGKLFRGYGNNPQGAVKIDNGNVIFLKFKENDKCCDMCNGMYVLPGKMCKYSNEKR